MKTTSIFILALFSLFLWSCQEDVPMPIEPDPCGATELGITEVARQIDSELAGAVLDNDKEWSWTRKGDTLIVRYQLGGWCTYHATRYLKFEITDCIRLVRDYRHGINVALSITSTVSNTFTDYELNFELQEWDEKKILVGRNNDIAFWIDFNEDNRY